MKQTTKDRIKVGIGVAAFAAVAVLVCTLHTKKPEPDRNCVLPKGDMVVCPNNIKAVQETLSCFDDNTRELEIKKGTRFKEGEPMGTTKVTPKVETIAPGFHEVELIAPDGTKGWVKAQDCPQNK